MDKIESNAARFINAYNTIDYTLRSLYDFKKSITFTEAIRKSVMYNSVVRKYEDDLIDYGRLRNAIIHRSNVNYIIAEPHIDVVEKIERLAEILSTPPLALDRISNKEIISMQANESIREVAKMIGRSGYSNIPILDKNRLIGVANGQRLLDLLGREMSKNEKINIDAYMKNTKIGSVVEELDGEKYYHIANEKLSIEEAMHLFEVNRKLLIIIITKRGERTSYPLGLITITDVIEMQKVLNVY